MTVKTAIQDALGIPQAAREYIDATTPPESYRNMIANGGLPTMELRTFALCNTPIVRNSTGETVGFVAYWWLPDETTAVYEVQGDWLKLLGVVDDVKDPDGPQCEELWARFWNSTGVTG